MGGPDDEKRKGVGLGTVAAGAVVVIGAGAVTSLHFASPQVSIIKGFGFKNRVYYAPPPTDDDSDHGGPPDVDPKSSSPTEGNIDGTSEMVMVGAIAAVVLLLAVMAALAWRRAGRFSEVAA